MLTHATRSAISRVLHKRVRCLSLNAHPSDAVLVRLIARRVVPFESDVLQSWCNTDPAADHAAVDFVAAQIPRQAGARRLHVLAATGAGDSILSLLTNPHVETVASVSHSAAQHHLTTLKLALALSDLPTDTILTALGMHALSDPVAPAQVAERTHIFSTAILPLLHKLNPATAQFWQDRLAREVPFGLGRCGREQRLRAHRLQTLEQMDAHARDMLARDAASAHNALHSQHSVQEALIHAAPAVHLAPVYSIHNSSPHTHTDADTDTATNTHTDTHSNDTLTHAQLDELHTARAHREALMYYDTLKQPNSHGNGLVLAYLALCNSFPHADSAHAHEHVLPDWLTDAGRDALRQRAQTHTPDASTHAETAHMCELHVQHKHLLCWQSVYNSLSHGARELQYDTRLCTPGAGFDVISTGQLLDTCNTVEDVSQELGSLQRCVNLSGVTVARRVQGGLNGAMAQHMILHTGLEHNVTANEHSVYYGGSAEHVSAGVEDSF